MPIPLIGSAKLLTLERGEKCRGRAVAPRRSRSQQAPDREAIRALRAETAVETVLVHGKDLSDAERKAWSAAGADGGRLRLVVRDGDDVLLEVSDAERR